MESELSTSYVLYLVQTYPGGAGINWVQRMAEVYKLVAKYTEHFGIQHQFALKISVAIELG